MNCAVYSIGEKEDEEEEEEEEEELVKVEVELIFVPRSMRVI